MKLQQKIKIWILHNLYIRWQNENWFHKQKIPCVKCGAIFETKLTDWKRAYQQICPVCMDEVIKQKLQYWDKQK